MTDLTDEQKTEYFRRSYTAVDGLWFMKVEEKLGFDEALRLDEAVWKVLPKIQARALKGMMHLEGGLQGLQQALSARLALEGFDYEMEKREDGFAVIVKRCPWHDLMIKSGRGELSERVSDLICRVENSVWASEFSGVGEAGQREHKDRANSPAGRKCDFHGYRPRFCALIFCALRTR